MQIIQKGTLFTINDVSGTFDKLPLGVYTLRYSDQMGYYLSKTEDFQLPDKLYGDFSIIQRWINNYNNRSRNLGILLSGLKGAGKTIIAKKLCIDLGKPVILIQDCYDDDDFKTFLTNDALGDCIIFIDEFEKVYERNSQEAMLSLLDGPYTTHHLYLFTVNEANINHNMINRPSRIFYHKHYNSLDDETVQDVIKDLLVNKDHEDSIYLVLDKVGSISFDILISLISDMNLYNEDAHICASHMNLSGDYIPISVVQLFEGSEKDVTYDNNLNLIESKTLEVMFYKRNEQGELDNSYMYLDIEEIKRISRNTWEYNKDGLQFRIKRREFHNVFL